MTLPDLLVKLATLGLSSEQLKAVAEIIAEVTAPSPGALRMRRHRERHKPSPSDVTRASHVTSQVTLDARNPSLARTPLPSLSLLNPEDNQEVRDKPERVERERESEGEPNIVTLHVTPRKPHRGTRLPAFWEPSPAARAWALERIDAADLDGILDTFNDYWTAKSGANATKLDWDATFRNWVRRDLEQRKTRYVRKQPIKQGAVADIGNEILADLAVLRQQRDHRGS